MRHKVKGRRCGNAFVMDEQRPGGVREVYESEIYYLYVAQFIGPMAPAADGKILMKVGISGDPKARLDGLVAAMPFGIMMLSRPMPSKRDARLAEKRLHEAFHPASVGREWFAFLPGDAETVSLAVRRALRGSPWRGWRFLCRVGADVGVDNELGL